jgi:hypothetical protein
VYDEQFLSFFAIFSFMIHYFVVGIYVRNFVSLEYAGSFKKALKKLARKYVTINVCVFVEKRVGKSIKKPKKANQ